jgi:hypothetical protein
MAGAAESASAAELLQCGIFRLGRRASRRLSLSSDEAAQSLSIQAALRNCG